MHHLFSNKRFALTAVYGSNDEEERHALWQFLTAQSNTHLPWLIPGDFNHPLQMDDRIGGVPVTLRETEDFQKCAQSAGFQDVAWKGCRYLWTSKQGFGQRIFSRIDRIMANSQWLTEFPNSEVIFHPDDTSDHYPGLLKFLRCSRLAVKPFDSLTCGLLTPTLWR